MSEQAEGTKEVSGREWSEVGSGMTESKVESDITEWNNSITNTWNDN